MARQWMYDRLPKGVSPELVDSLMDSFGDTEQQAQYFSTLGMEVPHTDRFWPYQQNGAWKIGPGIDLGPVGNLTAEQQSQLNAYQNAGMSRLAGYQRVIDRVTEANTTINKLFKQQRIRAVPEALKTSIIEASLYRAPEVVMSQDTTRALRAKRYGDVLTNITDSDDISAPLTNKLAKRVADGSGVAAEDDLVQAILRNTARNETGVDNFSRMSQIQPEQNGTKSYGILGLNSGTGASMETFVDKYGGGLGLTAKIGSPEFDQQWLSCCAGEGSNDSFLEAHEKYVTEELIKPAQQKLTTAGLGKLNNDPGVVNSVADTIVQMGPGLTDSALRQINERGVDTPDQFFETLEAVTVGNVDSNYKTHLSKRPQDRPGLINRLRRRAQQGAELSRNSRARVPRQRGGTRAINPPPSRAPVPSNINDPAPEVVSQPEVALTSIERELAPEIISSIPADFDATLPAAQLPGQDNREVSFFEEIVRQRNALSTSATSTSEPQSTPVEAQPQSFLDVLVPRDGSAPDVQSINNFGRSPRDRDFNGLPPEARPERNTLTEIDPNGPINEAEARQLVLSELRQLPIEEQRQAILDQQRREADEAVFRRTAGLVESLTDGSQQRINNAGAALDGINAQVAETGSANNAALRAATVDVGDIPLGALNQLLDAQQARAELDNPETQSLRDLAATRTALNRLNAGRVLNGEPTATVTDTLPVLSQANILFNDITNNQAVRNEALAALDDSAAQLSLSTELQNRVLFGESLQDTIDNTTSTVLSDEQERQRRLLEKVRESNALTGRLNFNNRR